MGKSVTPPSVKAGIPRLTSVPKGWRKYRFGEILNEVARPISLKDEEVYQLVVARRSRGGIEPRERLPGKHVLTKTQFEIKSGDFLISNRQIVHGACGVVPESLDGSVVSNEYTVLHPSESLDLNFLNHYTHTTYFQRTCFHSSVGVDVEKMIFRINDWFKQPVALPPLPEQKKIAEVLSCWDRGIEEVDHYIDWCRHYLKATLVCLRNDPKAKKVQLGELGKWVGGGTPSKARYEFWTGGNIPWVSPKDMSAPEIYDSEDHITEEAVQHSSTTLLPAGALLMVTRSGVLRHTLPVGIAKRAVAINQDIKALIPKGGVPVIYTREYLRAFQAEFLSSCAKVGTTVESIDFDALKKFVINVPDEVVIQGAERLIELQSIALNSAISLRRSLALQKQGLMQQLLTGKTRIKVVT